MSETSDGRNRSIEDVINEIEFAKLLEDRGIGPRFFGVAKEPDGRLSIVTEYLPDTDPYSHVNIHEHPDATELLPQLASLAERFVEDGIVVSDFQVRVHRDSREIFVVDVEEYDLDAPGSGHATQIRDAYANIADRLFEENSSAWPAEPLAEFAGSQGAAFRAALDEAAAAPGPPLVHAGMERRLRNTYADWTTHPAFRHLGPKFALNMAKAAKRFRTGVLSAYTARQADDLTPYEYKRRVLDLYDQWLIETNLPELGRWA